GITKDGMFHKMTKDQWYAVINTNLNSLFNMCRPVIDGMRERGFGRIINISSINGQKGQMGQTNYSAAKAGDIGFTKALALEAQPYGIRVHAVCPGVVATQMSAVTHADRPDRMEPEDVAQAVVYLLSLSPQAAVDELVLRRNGAVPWSS
ncbi:MAG TPA: SDR family NAD(P)-dependent oxidoreductase, partial [Armatimonadota bacterium]|nr:SDR family NAD(P)-dependent oxidoreductase [Armatimonadota bacterium]